MEDSFVLAAAKKLLLDDKYQDVSFKCSDGCIVGCNRAFLAATNDYFDRLLYGGLLESASNAEIRLQAPSAALRHVLQYLHSGSFTTIDDECCWVLLLETCSLAQQYMLPKLVQHIAGRLLEDLPPVHLGLALSFALKAQLPLVIKHIWVALPRLLQQPLAFDSTFSAEAICLCLQHTCWMARHATVAGGSTSTATPPPAADGAAERPRLWGELNRTSSTQSAGTPARDSSSSGDGSKQGVAEKEAEAYDAVIAWMLQEIAGCPECQHSRQQYTAEYIARDTASSSSSSIESSSSTASAHALSLAGEGTHQQSQQQQQQQPTHKPVGIGIGTSISIGLPSTNSGGSSSSSGALHPGGWTASGSTSSSSRRAIPAPPRTISHSTVRYSKSGTAAAGMSRSSSTSSEVAAEPQLPPPPPPPAAAAAATAAADSTDLAGSVDAANSSSNSCSCKQRPYSAPPMMQAKAGSGSFTAASHYLGPGASPASGTCSLCGASGAEDTATAEQQQQQQQQQHGHCCAQHEAVLLQLLARLNWHLLPPSALEQLENLSLLSPPALLDIYRALQRCSHMALHGSFPACLTATIKREGSGEQGRLRCYTAGGEQVLECDSPAHMTSTASLAFTGGKHCWQFVVLTPCDLVWIGLGDGSLAPETWGGKQSGGWFYGSNDALCHDKHSDKHAYDKHCGHGQWGAGAVIDVCLDMDAREVWFGVDGAPLKLGFSDLPDRVYPAVSLRAPGQLLVRFRAASWLMAAA